MDTVARVFRKCAAIVPEQPAGWNARDYATSLTTDTNDPERANTGDQHATGDEDVSPRNGNRVRGACARPRVGSARSRCDPSRGGRTRFRHSGQHHRGGRRGVAFRMDALWPGSRAAAIAGGHRELSEQFPRHRIRSRQHRGDAGRQADHVLHDPRAAGSRRRGDLSQPGIPDLRIDDQLHRGESSPLSHSGEVRVRARCQ